MSERNGKTIVVMHNNLARHRVIERMAELSIQSQRVIAFLVAHCLDHTHDEFPEEIEGNVADLAQACGLTGHDIHRQVKDALDSLLGCKIAFPDPVDGSDFATVWLYRRNYYPGEGRFRCRFSPDLRPVLLDLHKHRTEMDLGILLSLGGGSYAHRLYTLAKSWQSLGGWVGSVRELRGQLGVPEEAYSRIADFMRFAIDYPLNSINSRSDIRVSYEPVKSGRRITHIRFSITAAGKAKARTIDPKNPQNITDLPLDEQKEAWAWIRTQPIGSDLGESVDWAAIHTDGKKILKYWRTEQAQEKFEF